MATVSANKLELLQIADAVAREKAIDRKIVLGAMEDAIAKAARSRYGSETEVRAEIDPKSGELQKTVGGFLARRQRPTCRPGNGERTYATARCTDRDTRHRRSDDTDT